MTTGRVGVLGHLSRLLRVRGDEVEAVLRHDESRARETVRMQRRGFLSASAALAAAPFVPQTWLELPTPVVDWTMMLDRTTTWGPALSQARAFHVAIAFSLMRGIEDSAGK